MTFNEYEKELIVARHQKGMKTYFIEVTLDEGCLLKAARTYMVFRNLEEIGEIIKSNPTVQELEEEKFDNSFVVAFLSGAPVQDINKEVQDISEVRKVTIEEYKEAIVEDASVQEAKVEKEDTPKVVAQKKEQKRRQIQSKLKRHQLLE